MREIRQSFSVCYEFPVIFTRGALRPENRALERIFRQAGPVRHRVFPVADAQVLDAVPGLEHALVRYAEAHKDRMELVDGLHAVPGGEVCKGRPEVVGELQSLLERRGLCRQSFVLAIGGGAALDVVGFAASTVHRGLRLLRMPTTVLAQCDAGVGVKNGVNAFGRKNFLGTFAPPYAVVNDFDFLDTLPERDRRSGIAEAVKVALIKDRSFFQYLWQQRSALASFDREALEHTIVRCAELHLRHIATSGDPFEFGSARPLDFGHWSAHSLEERTAGGLKHGEAVAIGVALDSLYCLRQGRLDEADCELVLSTLEALGFELWHEALRELDVAAALDSFREHLGGALSVTLLQEIGHGVEVGEMDAPLVERCIGELAERGR